MHLARRRDGSHAARKRVHDEYDGKNDAGRRKVIAHQALPQLSRRDHLRQADRQHHDREKDAGHGSRADAEEFIDDARNRHLFKAAV